MLQPFEYKSLSCYLQGTLEAFTGMDGKQDAFAFGNQHRQGCRAGEQDFTHASYTDSEQSSEEAAEEERRATRRQRLRSMASWGKRGKGSFPTPPSDTTSEKPNNVDF